VVLRTFRLGAPPLALVLCLTLVSAPTAFGQLGILGGGPGEASFGGWPRYREYRDLAGQSYTDVTPSGRRGYFVPLPSPGYDDIGNGPSMAYSPIFNAPQTLPRPGKAAGPAAGPQARPTGFLRRIFRRN
jgi:hypothetical protein